MTLREFLHWLNLGGAVPAHEHEWELVRVTYAWCHGGFLATYVGPLTFGMWRCKTCNRKRTSEHEGYWRLEELRPQSGGTT